MNTKNRIEKIARRTLAKRIFFFIDDFCTTNESIENRKYIFEALRIYIWFSLLYIALPDLAIYQPISIS